MKVLFLDIDGVLNSHRSAAAFGGFPFDISAHRARFDEVAIALVRNICRQAGAVVILSSSWRNDTNWLDIGKALDLPIVDRTPSLLGSRGTEIGRWLSGHPEVECYAIVDDDPDMLAEQQPFFVKSNPFEGLSWNDADKLGALLGVSIYDLKAPGSGKLAPAPKLAWEE